MELVQLEHFALLAEHLHFRRAAGTAGVSASTLSRQISELEEDLGFRLFDRNRRQVHLTPAGVAFLGEVQTILHRLRFAALDAGRIARGEQVRLRIGHGDAVGTVLLRHALPELRAAYPDLRMEVVEGPSEELLDGLVSRAVDVALLRPPVHLEGISDEALCNEQLVVALTAGHPLARRSRVSLADLDGEPLVVPPRSTAPGAYDTIMGMFAFAHVHTNVVEEGNTASSVNLLVAAGLGSAITPLYSTRHFESGVEVRPLTGHPATLPLHVAWRADDANQAVQALRRILTAAVGTLVDGGAEGLSRPLREIASNSDVSKLSNVSDMPGVAAS